MRSPIVAVALLPVLAAAAPRVATEKPGPQKSGFYDRLGDRPDFSPGIGQIPLTCRIAAASQPLVYAGNLLVDCDGEVPHNETHVAVNPRDPSHAVAAFHSYHLSFRGATVISRVVGTAAATFDGGATWQLVAPPITPYQFTGDPALAFDSRGKLYFANIADHEGPGGSFTAPSVVVATSGDGGLTWTKLVTVARGHGAITPGVGTGQDVFQDKEFIAVDQGLGSPFRDRAYVTWTSFQDTNFSSRSPIQISSSHGGLAWSPPLEISGSGPFCSGGNLPGACDFNQDSYPAVAPQGRVYVTFENFNTPAENQILAVRSDDGGRTWTAPVRVDTVFDVNLPRNSDRRDTLTGCALRVGAVANSAADPSDPTGKTTYVVWADNRNGTAAATNMDVFVARTADGGATWKTVVVDASPNDQFFPAVAVAPDGRVDVGYMDRSPSAGQGECRYGFTLARLRFDGAGNVASNTKHRVDTALSDAGHSRWFSSAANPATLFIGDYNGVAVGPDGSTWSAWTDMRATVANPPLPTRNHGQHAVATRTAP